MPPPHPQRPLRSVSPWLMLFVRPAGFAGLQLLVTAVLAVRGTAEPLRAAAAGWLWYATLTNLVCLVLLVREARARGQTFLELVGFAPAEWRGDLPWLGLNLLLAGPLAFGPNLLLGTWLFGDVEAAGRLLFQPLPPLVVYPLVVLMPLTHGLAELPTYWAHASPGLRARGLGRWSTLVLVGSVLALQHVALGFLPDWRFVLWRGAMFFPFALWTGWLIGRRPTLLPYLMASHVLMDAMLPISTLLASRPQ